MDVDPRAVRTLDAHLAYLRFLTAAGEGAIHDRDGMLFIRNPVPLPFIVNAAARTDEAVDGSTVIDAAHAFFQGQGFEVVCLDGRDDDLRDAAERAGMRRGSPDPLQYLDRPVGPGPPDRRPVAEIHVVEDAAGIADVVAVSRDAHAVYDLPDELFGVLFAAQSSVIARDVHAVVATLAGDPVATAQVFMDGDIAYVGWVSVVRRATRQGLGRLVTEAVVNEGLARGARAAALMGSPMGAPLYRKMGFIDVGVLTNAYFRPSRA